MIANVNDGTCDAGAISDVFQSHCLPAVSLLKDVIVLKIYKQS